MPPKDIDKVLRILDLRDKYQVDVKSAELRAKMESNYRYSIRDRDVFIFGAYDAEDNVVGLIKTRPWGDGENYTVGMSTTDPSVKFKRDERWPNVYIDLYNFATDYYEKLGMNSLWLTRAATAKWVHVSCAKACNLNKGYDCANIVYMIRNDGTNHFYVLDRSWDNENGRLLLKNNAMAFELETDQVVTRFTKIRKAQADVFTRS